MTTTEHLEPSAAGSNSARRPRGGTWRLSVRGLRTVAGLELRQRVRSTRWVIVLAVWTAVVGGLTTLIRLTMADSLDTADQERFTAEQAQQALTDSAGATMFGVIIFLVLGLAGLIAPALTATSINGDRMAGVLATLQTSLLSPAEIAVGKLLAAWVTALALLATASPFILWAYLEGGTPAARLLVTVALVAVMLLVICAIALGWSAVTARTSTSAVLTYLSVTFLALGLPLLFLLSMILVRQNDQVLVWQAYGDSPSNCVERVESMRRVHSERTWWLLAADPFVVVADAAPRPTPGAVSRGVDDGDPLSTIGAAVREARLGPAAVESWCYVADTDSLSAASPEFREAIRQRERDLAAMPAAWPFGLAANLAVGGAFVVLTVRRLRAPARKLPRGTRVA